MMSGDDHVKNRARISIDKTNYIQLYIFPQYFRMSGYHEEEEKLHTDLITTLPMAWIESNNLPISTSQ